MRPGGCALILDRFMPVYEFREFHALEMEAPRERVFQALKEVTPAEIPFLKLLFALRSLPAWPSHRGPSPFSLQGPFLEQALAFGFTLLGETPGQEIALGIVGQFWRPAGGDTPRLRGPEDFLAFDSPGYARASIAFSAQDLGSDKTHLATETRVHVPDGRTRRVFAAYWALIRPGSGLLRRMMLRSVLRRVQRP